MENVQVYEPWAASPEELPLAKLNPRRESCQVPSWQVLRTILE
jgi:hypothetical protein